MAQRVRFQRHVLAKWFRDNGPTSREWLANQVDVSPDYLRQITLGCMQPGLKLTARIAEVLNIDINELLSLPKVRPPGKPTVLKLVS